MNQRFLAVSDNPAVVDDFERACIAQGRSPEIVRLTAADLSALAPREFGGAILDLAGAADPRSLLGAAESAVRTDGVLLLRVAPGTSAESLGGGAGDRYVLVPAAIWSEQVGEIAKLVLANLELRRDQYMLAKETELLKNVQALFLTRELDKAYASIVRTVSEMLGLSLGQALLHDEKSGSYTLALRLDSDAYREEPAYALPPALLDGFLAGDRKWQVEPMREAERGSLLLLPLRTRNSKIGALRLHVPKGTALAPDQLHFAGRFAEEISQVVENLILINRTKELTIRDDLTQAYNRRYFESFIDEELERSRRYGGKFSIIFLDLDNLKDVNNRYGHLMGSRTLQEVSSCIISAVRGVDKVIRFGGDEFCIILPQTDHIKALAVARRVRDSISRQALALTEGIAVTVTASFGIASYPLHATTKEELLQKADQAMYKVKQAQKNAVLVAQLDNVEA